MLNKKWKDLVLSYGVYESPTFYTGIPKKYWLLSIEKDSVLNGGKINMDYSVSYDNLNWSEWKTLYETDAYILENIVEQELYFKFRVTILISPDNVSPTLKSVSISFRELHRVDNIGDMVCKPKLWITKKNGDGNIALYNIESRQALTLKNLKDGEQIFVDCKEEDIITSLPLTYRFDDHNDVFIEFLKGENYLYGTGNFELDIKYQMNTLV